MKKSARFYLIQPKLNLKKSKEDRLEELLGDVVAKTLGGPRDNSSRAEHYRDKLAQMMARHVRQTKPGRGRPKGSGLDPVDVVNRIIAAEDAVAEELPNMSAKARHTEAVKRVAAALTNKATPYTPHYVQQIWRLYWKEMIASQEREAAQLEQEAVQQAANFDGGLAKGADLLDGLAEKGLQENTPPEPVDLAAIRNEWNGLKGVVNKLAETGRNADVKKLQAHVDRLYGLLPRKLLPAGLMPFAIALSSAIGSGCCLLP
jgi:hypothetical protein